MISSHFSDLSAFNKTDDLLKAGDFYSNETQTTSLKDTFIKTQAFSLKL